ncbi:hypothetical protein [Actinoplanes sp. NPDC049316]|uniref:hypothetical protein n=1 Tax=Actinoplanes sp. NPDC049316 TaxID=3154727 RepID=UPI00341E6884
MPPIRVTVWGENRHEHAEEHVRAIYPDGMHETIAAVLTWWGHAGDACAAAVFEMTGGARYVYHGWPSARARVGLD